MSDSNMHEGFEGWSRADSAVARSEGWDIWDCGPEDGLQLCKCDETNVFKDDMDAWKRVWLRSHDEIKSRAGIYTRALAFIKTNNPKEHQAIQVVMGVFA